MSHKFNPEKADKLVSAARYQELKPDILLKRLGIRPGSTILDLGCGNGFFTFPAAVAMGEGMVIAADISQSMLSLLNRRNPPENIQVLKVEEVAMDIEDDSVDATIIIFLYHEFKAPRENLAEIKRVLKPKGTLMILDWDPLAERERGPSKDHRILQSVVLKDLESAGFKVAEQENYVDDVWMTIAHLKD